MALALTWGGAVDTGVQFSEFFDDNCTITIRFLRRYPHAYAGPFITVGGSGASGTFFVGQGDWGSPGLIPTLAPGLPQPAGLPNLVVAIGSQTFNLGLPADDDWHHLALVRKAGATQVFLDGDAKGSPVVKSGTMPVGSVVLGRSTGRPPRGKGNQFFGLLDDFAIFKTSLSNQRVADLATAKRLSGKEPDLLVGYTFGFTPSGGLPPTLNRPLASRTPAAKIVEVSDVRTGSIDLQKMPLPLNAHMRLPFPRGEEWRVSQGNDDPTVSHRGYAAFCWDFVNDEGASEGAGFLSSSPGTVTGLRESEPSGTNTSNFVTVRQAPGEFVDYLHLKTSSVPVKVGDSVGFGTVLGAVSNTGTGGAHLHLAVTTTGEENAGDKDFFTVPAAFSNYEVRDSSGEWKRVIRGIPKKGHVVRNPKEDGRVMYNAVWQKRDDAEIQVYGWKYDDYRAKYNALWDDGWRLHQIRVVTLDETPRYTAVWRKRGGGEKQVYQFKQKDFADKHAELAAQGWMLDLLTVFSENGSPRYTGVWRPGSAQQDLVLGVPRAQCEEKAKQRREGWHLQSLATFSVMTVDLYSGVWTKGERGVEEFIHGVPYSKFRSTYDGLWDSGWRLSHLAVCNPAQSDPLFTAYWRKTGGSEIQVYRWNYEDVRARYDVLWDFGWRLKLIEPYLR